MIDIDINSSFTNVLEAINNNKLGIVFITEHSKIVGVISDGDVRRYFLHSNKLPKAIKFLINYDFKFLTEDYEVDEALAIFSSSEKIYKVLPIVDANNYIVNYLYRNNFLNSFITDDLLNNQNFNESFNEVGVRPWGLYFTIFDSNLVKSKIIVVFSGQRISYQAHKKRDEFWFILDGECEVKINHQIFIGSSKSHYSIKRNEKHYIKNIGNNHLIFHEIQTGDYFGEDDIKRFDDIYNRN